MPRKVAVGKLTRKATPKMVSSHQGQTINQTTTRKKVTPRRINQTTSRQVSGEVYDPVTMRLRKGVVRDL